MIIFHAHGHRVPQNMFYGQSTCGANAQKNSRPKKQPETIDYTSVNLGWLGPEPEKQPEAI